MRRPNAFGVVERVLNLYDELTEAKLKEAQLELNDKGATIRDLQLCLRKLEAQIRGHNDALQQSIHENFQLKQKHERQLARICELHPEVVVE
jgi:hypothetical protein